jgi:hypothetical protein
MKGASFFFFGMWLIICEGGSNKGMTTAQAVESNPSASRSAVPCHRRISAAVPMLLITVATYSPPPGDVRDPLLSQAAICPFSSSC